jgi:hypothetical protein
VDVDELWKHESILGKQTGMRLKTEAFMQQREREAKQRHEDNLPDHKQAEVDKFPVDSDIAMPSAHRVSGQCRSQQSRYGNENPQRNLDRSATWGTDRGWKS